MAFYVRLFLHRSPHVLSPHSAPQCVLPWSPACGAVPPGEGRGHQPGRHGERPGRGQREAGGADGTHVGV